MDIDRTNGPEDEDDEDDDSEDTTPASGEPLQSEPDAVDDAVIEAPDQTPG